MPQDDTRRAELIASLVRLWDYIRELIAKHLSVPSGGGGLFGPGWAMMADPKLSGLMLFVSDDASPLNPLAQTAWPPRDRRLSSFSQPARLPTLPTPC